MFRFHVSNLRFVLAVALLLWSVAGLAGDLDRLLSEYSPLRLPGAIIVQRADGWVVISAGEAKLEPGSSGDGVITATLVAEHAAMVHMVELLHGSRLKVVATDSVAVHGDSEFEMISTETTESMAGRTRRAVKLGTLVEDELVRVYLAIAQTDAGLLDFTEEYGQRMAAWQRTAIVEQGAGAAETSCLLSCGAVLQGGTTICRLDGRLGVMAVGVGMLATDDSVGTFQAKRIAEIDARRRLAEYQAGVNNDQVVTGIEKIQIENGVVKAVLDSLYQRNTVSSGSWVDETERVGTWKNPESTRIFIALFREVGL